MMEPLAGLLEELETLVDRSAAMLDPSAFQLSLAQEPDEMRDELKDPAERIAAIARSIRRMPASGSASTSAHPSSADAQACIRPKPCSCEIAAAAAAVCRVRSTSRRASCTVALKKSA
jgi:hypothetical protein